ncbi:hypothetical protein FRC05_005946 [Tulasnella sp. 425]|nr:hypothetical protein FRC05_005946 [Tulasnella sp. 425]
MFGPAQYPLAVGDGGDAEELEVRLDGKPEPPKSRLHCIQIIVTLEYLACNGGWGGDSSGSLSQTVPKGITSRKFPDPSSK